MLEGKVAIDAQRGTKGGLVFWTVVFRGSAPAIKGIISRAVTVRPQRV